MELKALYSKGCFPIAYFEASPAKSFFQLRGYNDAAASSWGIFCFGKHGYKFSDWKQSQKNYFSTCIFFWIECVTDLTTFISLVSGQLYFLKNNFNPFLGGRKKTSSVHKSPAHWMESCIFKLYFHSLSLINSVCDNVGLFVIQALRQHCFQVLWNLTYFAFSIHTPPLNIQIMCLAEPASS